VICSITSIGLAIPPAQKAFQTLSIFERNSPVSMPLPDPLDPDPSSPQRAPGGGGGLSFQS